MARSHPSFEDDDRNWRLESELEKRTEQEPYRPAPDRYLDPSPMAVEIFDHVRDAAERDNLAAKRGAA